VNTSCREGRMSLTKKPTHCARTPQAFIGGRKGVEGSQFFLLWGGRHAKNVSYLVAEKSWEGGEHGPWFTERIRRLRSEKEYWKKAIEGERGLSFLSQPFKC
jgi:hypothetical protein